jgi:hypothetical protein
MILEWQNILIVTAIISILMIAGYGFMFHFSVKEKEMSINLETQNPEILSGVHCIDFINKGGTCNATN